MYNTSSIQNQPQIENRVFPVSQDWTSPEFWIEMKARIAARNSEIKEMLMEAEDQEVEAYYEGCAHDEVAHDLNHPYHND